MKEDGISDISIDDEGKLRVYPASSAYDYIYRSAAEVHWNKEGKYLYSPRPREWDYSTWFAQIINAVKSEYGVLLKMNESTEWKNIPGRTKEKIILWAEKDI